jgi:hypothetical protein
MVEREQSRLQFVLGVGRSAAVRTRASGTVQLADASVSTTSTHPLRAALTIEGEAAWVEIELDAELANKLCVELERFLTQPADDKRAGGLACERTAI